MTNILQLHGDKVVAMQDSENQIDEVAKLLSDLGILVDELCKIKAVRLARFTGFRGDDGAIRGAACVIHDVVRDLEYKRAEVQSAARGFE